MTSLIATRPRKPISLTALIDVVFILLMFFMVTTSFNKHRETTIQTAATSTETNAVAPLLLSINPQGQLQKIPEKTPIDDKWLATLPTDQTMLVYPEGPTEVQTIVTQLHHLKQLGFERVNIGEALPQ